MKIKTSNQVLGLRIPSLWMVPTCSYLKVRYSFLVKLCLFLIPMQIFYNFWKIIKKIPTNPIYQLMWEVPDWLIGLTAIYPFVWEVPEVSLTVNAFIWLTESAIDEILPRQANIARITYNVLNSISPKGMKPLEGATTTPENELCRYITSYTFHTHKWIHVS